MASSLCVQRLQLSDDPEDWVWIRWQWCQPGAQVMPWDHYALHPLWDNSGKDPYTGPQVRMAPEQYRPAQTSPHPGLDILGPREWWQDGIPLSARASEPTGPGCDGDIWGSAGAVTVPGDSDDLGGAALLAEGGQLQGGEAHQHGNDEIVAQGGQVQGGAAEQHGGYGLVGDGGQVQGGAAQQGGGLLLVAGGGAAQGGAAVQGNRNVVVGSGGSGQGGQGVQGAGYILTPAGGEAQGGVAAQIGGATLEAAGGQSQGGSARQISTWFADMAIAQSWVQSGGSTASTTYVTVGSEGVTFTLEQDTEVIMQYVAQAELPAAAETAFTEFEIDGVLVSQTEGKTTPGGTAAAILEHGARHVDVLTAGTHTIIPKHKTANGNSVTFRRRLFTVFAAG